MGSQKHVYTLRHTYYSHLQVIRRQMVSIATTKYLRWISTIAMMKNEAIFWVAKSVVFFLFLEKIRSVTILFLGLIYGYI